MHVISALFLFMPSYQTTLYMLWSLALSGYPVKDIGKNILTIQIQSAKKCEFA